MLECETRGGVLRLFADTYLVSIYMLWQVHLSRYVLDDVVFVPKACFMLVFNLTFLVLPSSVLSTKHVRHR